MRSAVAYCAELSRNVLCGHYQVHVRAGGGTIRVHSGGFTDDPKGDAGN